MLSRFVASVTFLSLGISVSSQTWGSTYAIRGVFDDLLPWVEATGSPLNVGINYISKPNGDTTFVRFKWFIQSAQNSTDPSTHVTFINLFGGVATPFGGEPRVCGGQGMLLRTSFGASTIWKLTPLGGGQYKISTNITTPNLGGVITEVFWSMHRTTGLLPLDQENRTDCTDSGGISQVFQFFPPEVLN
ncbi:hypothetical protein Agabi119p4_9676 [Agaricus bisporus var. burnettii]|uniref:Uncharacterized protein n=1 Tax=Agaricus bisporus var. burnettii TaxID=192524 RepID=A0A8H7C2V3_AGABI|nr:hypothetical protein Agabi119p4_9676 [Agaricus bisporus var. burnettii]